MNKDEKIKAAFQALQDSVRETQKYVEQNPEEPMRAVGLRAWLFASQIHLEHLEVLLHDLQPTLF